MLAIHEAIPTQAHPRTLFFTLAASLRAGGSRGPIRPHGFANVGPGVCVRAIRFTRILSCHDKGHAEQDEGCGDGEHLHNQTTSQLSSV